MIYKLQYAGLGTKDIPDKLKKKLPIITSSFEGLGYLLRVKGNAFDSPFLTGITNPKNKDIYLNKLCKKWVLDLYTKYEIKGNEFIIDNIDYRNSICKYIMCVLGIDGNKPVDFIITYVKDDNYESKDIGSVGYSLRLAKKLQIPIFNLFFDYRYRDLLEYLNNRIIINTL